MLLTSPLSSPLKNPVRDVFSPAASSQSLTAQVQSIVAAGGVGGMWDMGDTSTLYQDTAGATPVTAATQPIALVLDKGKALGSESLVNGNYVSGTSNWTIAVTGTAVVNTGVLRVTSTTGRGTASQSFTTVIGQQYRVRPGLISNGNAGVGAAILRITSDASYGGTLITQAGSASSNGYIFFTATTTTTYIWLAENTATPGNYVDFGSVSVKADSGNHATQATAGSRPLFSGPAFARFDGVDDSLAISTITLGANMDCFVAVRRNAAAKFMIGSGTTSGAKWFAVVDSGSAGPADDSVGIIATYTVDGAPINGGLPLVTRGQLEAALPISGWHVIEVRNLNLSTWSSLYFSGFSGFPLNGDIGGIVLCTAQSTGNRNLIRTYLGAKVGLTL